MCYPSPEGGEKKFSSPGTGKAKVIKRMVGVDTSQPCVASASVVQGGQTLLGEGSSAVKGL